MLENTFSTILVATDFSAGSDEALDIAITMAGRLGCKVELVHVVDAAVDLFPFGLSYYGAEERGGALDYVDRSLSERAARVRRAGLACDTRSLEGNADVEIVRRAMQIGAQLIVVGTHGRTGLAHILMGSVAERVVQHAAGPVLTVPFSDRAA